MVTTEKFQQSLLIKVTDGKTFISDSNFFFFFFGVTSKKVSRKRYQHFGKPDLAAPKLL